MMLLVDTLSTKSISFIVLPLDFKPAPSYNDAGADAKVSRLARFILSEP